MNMDASPESQPRSSPASSRARAQPVPRRNILDRLELETDAPFASTAEAVGGAYVLEGSTLGGRVLSRHVQGRFGRDGPRSFLESYGAGVRAGCRSLDRVA